MTVYGVITAAILRKLSAFIGEIRALVAEATAVEKRIISTAENQAEAVIAEAKKTEAVILRNAKADTDKLKNELIDKIAKL